MPATTSARARASREPLWAATLIGIAQSTSAVMELEHDRSSPDTVGEPAQCHGGDRCRDQAGNRREQRRRQGHGRGVGEVVGHEDEERVEGEGSGRDQGEAVLQGVAVAGPQRADRTRGQAVESAAGARTPESRGRGDAGRGRPAPAVVRAGRPPATCLRTGRHQAVAQAGRPPAGRRRARAQAWRCATRRRDLVARGGACSTRNTAATPSSPPAATPCATRNSTSVNGAAIPITAYPGAHPR